MIEVRPIAPRIGAEIRGADVRKLDEASFGVIYQAFLNHVLLLIRGQQLEIPDFLAFASRFGELKPHIAKRSHHPLHPELMVMDNRVADIKSGGEPQGTSAKPVLVKRGAAWHSDLMYEYVTAKATQLYALTVPSSGGDTLFANSYAAYETLPDSLKKRIEGLCGSYCYGGRTKRSQEMLEEADRQRANAVHPLVRVHPETGRKILFFNDGHICHIEGLNPADSDALILELKAHTETTDGDYRHTWQAGDVLIWDNRCSIHSATGNYPPDERRTMWRTTVMEPGWQRERLAG